MRGHTQVDTTAMAASGKLNEQDSERSSKTGANSATSGDTNMLAGAQLPSSFVLLKKEGADLGHSNSLTLASAGAATGSELKIDPNAGVATPGSTADSDSLSSDNGDDMEATSGGWVDDDPIRSKVGVLLAKYGRMEGFDYSKDHSQQAESTALVPGRKYEPHNIMRDHTSEPKSEHVTFVEDDYIIIDSMENSMSTDTSVEPQSDAEADGANTVSDINDESYDDLEWDSDMMSDVQHGDTLRNSTDNAELMKELRAVVAASIASSNDAINDSSSPSRLSPTALVSSKPYSSARSQGDILDSDDADGSVPYDFHSLSSDNTYSRVNKYPRMFPLQDDECSDTLSVITERTEPDVASQASFQSSRSATPTSTPIGSQGTVSRASTPIIRPRSTTPSIMEEHEIEEELESQSFNKPNEHVPLSSTIRRSGKLETSSPYPDSQESDSNLSVSLLSECSATESSQEIHNTRDLSPIERWDSFEALAETSLHASSTVDFLHVYEENRKYVEATEAEWNDNEKHVQIKKKTGKPEKPLRKKKLSEQSPEQKVQMRQKHLNVENEDLAATYKEMRKSLTHIERGDEQEEEVKEKKRKMSDGLVVDERPVGSINKLQKMFDKAPGYMLSGHRQRDAVYFGSDEDSDENMVQESNDDSEGEQYYNTEPMKVSDLSTSIVNKDIPIDNANNQAAISNSKSDGLTPDVIRDKYVGNKSGVSVILEGHNDDESSTDPVLTDIAMEYVSQGDAVVLGVTIPQESCVTHGELKYGENMEIPSNDGAYSHRSSSPDIHQSDNLSDTNSIISAEDSQSQTGAYGHSQLSELPVSPDVLMGPQGTNNNFVAFGNLVMVGAFPGLGGGANNQWYGFNQQNTLDIDQYDLSDQKSGASDISQGLGDNAVESTSKIHIKHPLQMAHPQHYSSLPSQGKHVKFHQEASFLEEGGSRSRTGSDVSYQSQPSEYSNESLRTESSEDWENSRLSSRKSFDSLDVYLDVESDTAEDRAHPERLDEDCALSLDLGPPLDPNSHTNSTPLKKNINKATSLSNTVQDCIDPPQPPYLSESVSVHGVSGASSCTNPSESELLPNSPHPISIPVSNAPNNSSETSVLSGMLFTQLFIVLSL